MIAYNFIKLVMVLVMLSLNGLVSSHHSRELNKLSNEEEHAHKYFAKILKSLVKLNEERVGSLKKLYLLNNYGFGKESLRTYVNNAEDYDDLIKSIKLILKELNNNKQTISNYPLNIYRTHNLNKRKRTKQNIDRILRQKTEDAISDSSDDIQKINKVLNVSIEDSSVEFTSKFQRKSKNDTLQYYYYYLCDDSEERCRYSCKEAYRYVCRKSRCTDRFRREMRRACRRACSEWFYD